MLVGLCCSAPPGTDDADDVPDFSGPLTPGTAAPSAVAPAAAPPGAGTGSAAAPAATGTQPAGTGAGGTSGNEQTGGNVPLQPTQGASSGQTSGAGGAAMVAPQPGTQTGSAGASMTAPGGGEGGASMTAPVGAGGASMEPSEPAPQNPQPQNPQPQNPQPQNPAPQNPQPQNPAPQNPVPSSNCTGQFFCDGFESVAAGASPTAALWTIIEGYTVRPASANVQVSAAMSHSGGRALRVGNTNSRTGVRATLPQKRYFVRAWLQIDSAPLGPVFIGLGTDQNSETRLRIQGRSFATINTFGPGDKVHPDAANAGNCADCVTLIPNKWFCAEMFIDDSNRNATLWIDGVEAASVINGEGGWPVQPTNPSLFLGSMSVQGGQTGVWIDDVVAGPERIGCN